MIEELLYIGTVKKEIDGPLSGQKLYIAKHEFSCGWYWSFGHIDNNKDLRKHFSELLHATSSNKEIDVFTYSEIFTDPLLYSDDDWWIIRDLFIQAYGLRKAADIYKCNGRQSSAPEARIILSDKLHVRINKDIGELLDQAWKILVNRRLKMGE